MAFKFFVISSYCPVIIMYALSHDHNFKLSQMEPNVGRAKTDMNITPRNATSIQNESSTLAYLFLEIVQSEFETKRGTLRIVRNFRHLAAELDTGRAGAGKVGR